MHLNNEFPGLPEWPDIFKTGKNEFRVEGKHISYRRYLLARWILRLAAAAYFYFLLKYEFRNHSVYEWQYPLGIVFLHFIIYIVIVTLVPVQKWICWLFLRRHTVVRFAKDHLVVNNKRYELPSNLDIQFRANRAPLSQGDVDREHPRQAKYLLNFRLVEMIYGHRVVPVASFEQEKWANQFTVALQVAFEESQSREAANDWQGVTDNTATGDWLPE